MPLLKLLLTLCFFALLELTSALRPSWACPPRRVICEDWTRCLPRSSECDGIEDCADGSDEKSCVKCGTRQMDKSLSSLLIGGDRVADGEFPWHAAIFINKYYRCGGVMVHNSFVLTAAHCVTYKEIGMYACDSWICDNAKATRTTKPKSFPSYSIQVYLGSTKLTSFDLRRRKPRICRIYIGNNFISSLPYLGDYALLELCSPVSYSYTIHPICWPLASDDCSHDEDNDEECYFTGWGRTAADSSVSEYLMKTKVTIQPMRECVTAGFTGGFDSKRQLCMKTTKSTARVCMYDAGGGVYCRNKAGYWVVRGLQNVLKTNCGSLYAIATSVCNYKKDFQDKLH